MVATSMRWRYHYCAACLSPFWWALRVRSRMATPTSLQSSWHGRRTASSINAGSSHVESVRLLQCPQLLITDLSSPHGQSVNGGIDQELCSLSYCLVEGSQPSSVGVCCWLRSTSSWSIASFRSTHRTAPCKPWSGKGRSLWIPCYRSAPKICSAVADALCWYFHQSGIRFIWHYADDYIVMSLGP